MSVLDKFISFVNKLTPEQIDKLITHLPELILQAEESEQVSPQGR